jgi:hypothetical protein
VQSAAIRCGLVVSTLLMVTSPARGECFSMTAQFVMDNTSIEFVFKGKAVDVTRTADLGYRVTFDVDRVWKGTVPKRIDLYVWELQAEIGRFDAGREYLALAKRLVDPRERDRVGLSGNDAAAFAPVSCWASVEPNIIRDLGVGRAPAVR